MRFLLIMALFIGSCSPGVSRKEAPKDLIEKEKMVEVMTELMKIEGHVNIKYLQVTKYHKLMKASADSLFKVNGISAEQFDASFEYYAHQQKDLKKIYEKVLNNLNHEMTELELEEQRQKDTVSVSPM